MIGQPKVLSFLVMYRKIQFFTFFSGDIVYYDDQQNFFVVDRLKELIKYKGFQVIIIFKKYRNTDNTQVLSVSFVWTFFLCLQ